jgi:MoxR-like ATPase
MDEFVVVERMTGRVASVVPVMTTERLLELQREVDDVYVDPRLMEYVVRIVSATRQPADYGLKEVAKYVSYGASPRASINLILTGRALAFLRGRRHVTGQDIQDLVLDVIRHRIVLSFEALSDEVTADAILRKVLERIPTPTEPMQEHVALRA